MKIALKASVIACSIALANCGGQSSSTEQKQPEQAASAPSPQTIYTAPTVDLQTRAKPPAPKQTPPKKGKFLDAAVQGAYYISIDATGKVTYKGYTGADGSFNYNEGDTTSFYVGDVLLGKTKIPSTGIVTPVSITKEFTQADALANMLRFLQTIDTDADPYNGIQLKQDVGKGMNVNFNLAAKDFKVQASLLKLLAVSTNSNSVPDITAAFVHFRDTMLDAYNTSGSTSILNLVNSTWQSTFTNEACKGTASATRRFTVIGPIYAGNHGVLPGKDGVTCNRIGYAIYAGFYEYDNIFSCAKGCTLADLNKTVTLAVPYPHTVHVAHEPNSGVITIVHEYREGTIVETMKKQ